jgi:hypothetical protein
MHEIIRVFVSYNHQDTAQMETLVSYLKGLEQDGVELWSDQRISTGQLWDAEIKEKIAGSQIALVLVSQAFLDSEYCTNVEVQEFIARNLVIFPIIVSACEWKRHGWLSSRQFLPGGDETIEEHYQDDGKRKRLYHDIRQDLRKCIEEVRSKAPADSDNPFTETLAIRDPARFIGREAELRRLNELLAGGSVAMVGEPKIGKSSVLYRLADTWEGDVVGPISFQGIDDRDDFYVKLAEELGEESSGWRGLRRLLQERTVLLLLGELDAAPDRGIGGQDLARFRSLCESNRGLRMVVAGRRHSKEIFPDDGNQGSPPYNFLQPFELGPMPEEEVRTLLAHPWAPGAADLDAASVNQIATESEGRPFKAQRGGYHRYQALIDKEYDWLESWKLDLGQML